MLDGYPFIFQMNDYSYSDNMLEYVMQYRFRSAKSNHTYIVRVEKYVEHTYCVKFFDKANMLSKNKFSLRSSTFEPRKIVSTVLNVMLEVYRQDNKASFFFIGAEDEKDVPGRSTRRFNFYADFVLSVISNRLFEHYRNDILSLYILVNKGSVHDMDAYVKRVNQLVADAMLG